MVWRTSASRNTGSPARRGILCGASPSPASSGRGRRRACWTPSAGPRGSCSAPPIRWSRSRRSWPCPACAARSRTPPAGRWRSHRSSAARPCAAWPTSCCPPGASRSRPRRGQPVRRPGRCLRARPDRPDAGERRRCAGPGGDRRADAHAHDRGRGRARQSRAGRPPYAGRGRTVSRYSAGGASGASGEARGDPAGGVVSPLEVVPLPGLPEIRPGDELAPLLLEAVHAAGLRLADGDVLAVTSKVVAKAEGRLVPLPAAEAERERVRGEVVAAETVRVVARRGAMVIAETRHGLVGANALIDESNAGGDALVLLPEDPDASAARLRAALASLDGHDVAVVVTDTLGRPWRRGQTDVAVGMAGMGALEDYRGRLDGDGRVLEVTEVAVEIG